MPENELHLCKRDVAKTIDWKLPPSGAYKFRDDEIDSMNLPNLGRFRFGGKAQGPSKYSWEDKVENGGGVSFNFAIRIHDGSGHQCDKDPRISND